MTQPAKLSSFAQKKYTQCIQGVSISLFKKMPAELQAVDFFLNILGMPTISGTLAQFTSMNTCYRFAKSAADLRRIKMQRGLMHLPMWLCEPWKPSGEPGSCN